MTHARSPIQTNPEDTEGVGVGGTGFSKNSHTDKRASYYPSLGAASVVQAYLSRERYFKNALNWARKGSAAL
jgi:hypothetical protein